MRQHESGPTRARGLTAALWLSTIACQPPPPSESPPVEVTRQAIVTAYPAIRHAGYPGATSGARLMQPRQLSAVLDASFGVALTTDGEALIDDVLAVPLGGLDYESVIERSTTADVTKVLAMQLLAAQFCETWVPAAGIDTSAPVEDELAWVIPALVGRPADWATADRPALLTATNDVFADAGSEGWLAVCAYLLLVDGSILMY